MIDSDFFCVPWRKVRWILVHKQKKFYWLTLSHVPKWILRGDYISALVLRPQIFIRARDWPRLDITHPNGDGGLPKTFDRANLKFGLKFSVLATIISGLVGVTSQNIFHTTCLEAGVKHSFRTLKFGRRKNVQNSARFSTTFDFDCEYLRNYFRYPKSETNMIDSDSSRVPGKKSGELWSKNKKVLLATLSHPSVFFGWDYISAAVAAVVI